MPEVIVAVHAKMRVLGISVITDQCLPDALEPVSLPEIIATANEAEKHLRVLVRRVVSRIVRSGMNASALARSDLHLSGIARTDLPVAPVSITVSCADVHSTLRESAVVSVDVLSLAEDPVRNRVRSRHSPECASSRAAYYLALNRPSADAGRQLDRVDLAAGGNCGRGTVPLCGPEDSGRASSLAHLLANCNSSTGGSRVGIAAGSTAGIVLTVTLLKRFGFQPWERRETRTLRLPAAPESPE